MSVADYISKIKEIGDSLASIDVNVEEDEIVQVFLGGFVEIQAQHRPNRLKKPRTESVRDRSVRSRTESVGTDRIRRFCTENRDDAVTRRKIFRKEYILGLV